MFKYNNENSLARWKEDLKGKFRELTEENMGVTGKEFK